MLRAPLHRDVALMIAAFGLLRIFAIEGQGGAITYSDTGTYFDVGLFGGAQRLWTVPVAYNLLPGETLKVAAQVGVGIACWGALAWVVAGLPRHPGVARVGAAAVLVLGLTRQVTQWDMVLLSESFGVSLGVLVLAALLFAVRRPTPAALGFLLGAVTLWAFTRHVNVLALLAALPFAIVVVFLRLPRTRAAAVAAVLVLVSIWGAVSISRESGIWRLNSFSIISQRVLADPDATAFFEERGLQVTPELRRELEGPRGLASPAYREPSMQRFLEDEWRTAYLSYLVRHPLGTVRKPLEEASSLLSSDANLGKPRPVLPDAVQSVAFGLTPGDVPLLFVTATGLWVAAWLRRRGATPADAAAAAIVVLSAVWLGLVWHLSALELSRLTLPVAVSLRVGLLALLLLAADRLLRFRSVA